MNFKEWIIDLFKDERRSTSVKPLIAIIGTIFLCIALTINTFTDMNLSDNLIDAIVIITSIGMGSDSLDKFSLRKKPNDTTPPDSQ